MNLSDFEIRRKMKSEEMIERQVCESGDEG